MDTYPTRFGGWFITILNVNNCLMQILLPTPNFKLIVHEISAADRVDVVQKCMRVSSHGGGRIGCSDSG